MGNINVWNDKYDYRVKRLDGPHINKEGKAFVPTVGTSLSLCDAMQTEFSTDAHMTLYSLRDSDGTVTNHIPLFHKSCLKQIQQEGAELLANAVAFDWDCPGHIPLTAALLEDFLSKFLLACAADERLGLWRACYTSRHGCRVVYEYKEPVPVEDSEKRVLCMLKEFKRHNIVMDDVSKNWAFHFRLPKVVRDGLHTKDEPMFDLQMQDSLLDITQFKKADLRSMVVEHHYVRGGQCPDQEDSTALLYEEGAMGREVMTVFHKKAKAMIRNTSFFDAIFTNTVPLCGDTGRNEFFGQLLGVLVPKLIEKCRATPEQVFALLHDPLHDLEMVDGKKDPADHLWNMLQDIYEREHLRFAEDQEKKAEAVEAGQTALEKMADGMKQWCDAEALYSDDNAEMEYFVRSHIFANVGKFYYPLNADGWYSNLCLLKDQLVPRVRKCFLRDVIETEKLDVKGEPTSVSPVEISNSYATIVHEVRMSPLQGAQGRIDEMDGDKPILQLPMYQRNDFLPPEANDAVDGWLRALFGRHYVEGIKWIGYALDFEAGPICALSLTGDGSVGKKLLVEGLAECLVDPSTATGHDLCGKENGALLKTPFLIVNEGMPRARDMSPADTFKSYTAGDPIRVRELYKPPINVINPLRIIFTANDHGVLQEITKGKELTPETKKAMGERLLHFDVDDAAAKYLRNLGGRSYTERDGHRWIRGDSGQPSDYIVAKHFMWLYKNKPPRNLSERYCVMGNCHEAKSFQLATQSEHMPAVMRAIVGLVERAGNLKDHFILTKTGKLYVTMQGVLAYAREVNQEHVPERALEGVVKSLMKTSTPYQKDYLYYYQLDTGAIMEFAQPWGLPCESIRLAHEISKTVLP